MQLGYKKTARDYDICRKGGNCNRRKRELSEINGRTDATGQDE